MSSSQDFESQTKLHRYFAIDEFVLAKQSGHNMEDAQKVVNKLKEQYPNSLIEKASLFANDEKTITIQFFVDLAACEKYHEACQGLHESMYISEPHSEILAVNNKNLVKIETAGFMKWLGEKWWGIMLVTVRI